MNRTELFDKILKGLYDCKDKYVIVSIWGEDEFGICDDKIYDSIVSELYERDWIASYDDSQKDTVKINYNGQQIIEKYGSYSSFLESLNKAYKRTQAEKTVKIILSIIGGLGVIYGCVFTYLNYEKDVKIDKQKTEIENLNKKIDSILIVKHNNK